MILDFFDLNDRGHSCLSLSLCFSIFVSLLDLPLPSGSDRTLWKQWMNRRARPASSSPSFLPSPPRARGNTKKLPNTFTDSTKHGRKSLDLKLVDRRSSGGIERRVSLPCFAACNITVHDRPPIAKARYVRWCVGARSAILVADWPRRNEQSRVSRPLGGERCTGRGRDDRRGEPSGRGAARSVEAPRWTLVETPARIFSPSRPTERQRQTDRHREREREREHSFFSLLAALSTANENLLPLPYLPACLPAYLLTCTPLCPTNLPHNLSPIMCLSFAPCSGQNLRKSPDSTLFPVPCFRQDTSSKHPIDSPDSNSSMPSPMATQHTVSTHVRSQQRRACFWTELC